MKELTPARDGREGKQEEDSIIMTTLHPRFSLPSPTALSALQAPVQYQADASHSLKAFSYSLLTL